MRAVVDLEAIYQPNRLGSLPSCNMPFLLLLSPPFIVPCYFVKTDAHRLCHPPIDPIRRQAAWACCFCAWLQRFSLIFPA